MSVMQASISHFTLENLQVHPISIQMAVARSTQPKISFSGLVDQHIKESMVRLSVALKDRGLSLPKDHVTIHFTPAIYEKKGSDYDLALALGLLNLFGFIPRIPKNLIFLSELGLNGDLNGSDHFLAFYHHILQHHPDHILVTSLEIHSWLEQNHAPCRQVISFENLSEVIMWIKKTPHPQLPNKSETPIQQTIPKANLSPLKEVHGLNKSKLALLTSLISQTPLLFIGSPGVGKTLLITQAKHLLPPLSFNTWLEGQLLTNIRDQKNIHFSPPFRTPHYQASPEAFTGTYHRGKWIPGEFSLANGGILFLDELPHFKPQVLEALRTPLEERVFLLSRAHFHARLPAEFTLLSAMNPCPCGYFFVDPCACTCTHRQISTYLSRLSGPIRERFGIIHFVVPKEELTTFSEYPIDSICCLGNLRNQFGKTFQQQVLTESFKNWYTSHNHSIKTPFTYLNKRSVRHMTKIALALSLLREAETPNEHDWSLAWEFQNAHTCFTEITL